MAQSGGDAGPNWDLPETLLHFFIPYIASQQKRLDHPD